MPALSGKNKPGAGAAVVHAQDGDGPDAHGGSARADEWPGEDHARALPLQAIGAAAEALGAPFLQHAPGSCRGRNGSAWRLPRSRRCDAIPLPPHTQEHTRTRRVSDHHRTCFPLYLPLLVHTEVSMLMRQ